MYASAITSQFASFASKLEKSAHSDIAEVLRRLDKSLAKESLNQKIGQIKDFASLAPLSQEQGRPFFDVEGGNQSLQEEARIEFESIANKIILLTSK